MTGKELIDRTLQLLNYTDSYGNVSGQQSAEIYKRAVPVINQILADVRHVSRGTFSLIEKIDDELPVSEDIAVRVMPWGVGMLIAQGENDGDSHQMMSANYNRLRASIPRSTDRVRDVAPNVWL